MDKKLTRTIGYLKSTGKSQVSAVEPKEKKVDIKKEPPVEEEKKAEVVKPDLGSLVEIQKTKSLKIVNWINGHEEFKWGVMCTKLDIDRGNFLRLLKQPAPTVKIELIPKIEAFLKNYGYAE